jgi:hypothetical protein
MVNREISIGENQEVERSPEIAMENAITTLEFREAMDPNSARVQKPKEWLENVCEELLKEMESVSKRVGEPIDEAKKWVGGKIDERKQKLNDWAKENPATTEVLSKLGRGAGFVLDVGRVGTVLVFKILGGLWEFAKKLIMKKGKISIKEGRDIGNEMFNFDNKKEKK